MEFALLGTLFLILVAEFINGWTDAPNAIATVISTRALSPRIAIIMATCFNIIGAFAGTAVATTIATDIVKPDALDVASLASAMLAVIFLGIFAWRFGLPVSKSHALIAGLTGSALAVAGPSVLIWEGWSKVLLGLLFSSIFGSIGGWLIAKLIQYFCASLSPAKARKDFGRLQIISSAAMAFSHGSNDGQKFIGLFSLTLLLGNVYESFYVPWWTILICSIIMGLGTSIGGMRIIKTMGYRMVRLETYQGFAAETAAATIISSASFWGIPLSTTHTINTAIVGVGLARRANIVDWKIVLHIFCTWILTFPLCGLIAYFSAWIFQLLGISGLLGLVLVFILAVVLLEIYKNKVKRESFLGF